MDNLSTFLQILVAVGTIAVAILAIWGDWFRDRLASPKLSMSLRSSRGDLTKMNGNNVLYFHLIIQNDRRWTLAKGVQIVIKGIWRKAADGDYRPEDLATEIPLTWAFPQFSPINPSIRDSKICDLGFLSENSDHFKPSLYFYPNNFNGYVRKGESVRYAIGINADNFTGKDMQVVEVSWDGTWNNDLHRMESHLVVKEVENSG